MRFFKRKKIVAILILLLVGGGAAYWYSRPKHNNTQYNGAYRFNDGRYVFIAVREGDVLRYRMMDGESRALWPARENVFTAGPGWVNKEPVEITITFNRDSHKNVTGLRWQKKDQPEQLAERINLSESVFTFQSGDLKLRGKLVLPQGSGQFPAVVIVHGSGDESAVETYFHPYLFATHGIATMVYDKRGTGQSEGSFTQNFQVLARDTLAAVSSLRQQKAIDPDLIHLAGYSQGGWIAPIAATQDPKIRSLLIGYGPLVTVADEDRWGYVYALRKKGFGDQEIAQADAINNIISDIMDNGKDRWSDLKQSLDQAKNRPWYQSVKGSDSLLGFVTDTWMPFWVVRIYTWWKLDSRDTAEPFILRLYDPVPTLRSLKSTPSLWLMGGEDSSLPTETTISRLEELKSEGCPIEVKLYPKAEHGILRFEDKNGKREILSFESDYFPAQIKWLQKHSQRQ